jgi:hypothetical protein
MLSLTIRLAISPLYVCLGASDGPFQPHPRVLLRPLRPTVAAETVEILAIPGLFVGFASTLRRVTTFQTP